MPYSESFQTIVDQLDNGDLKKPIFDLTSVDNNVFSLMGHWGKAARKAKWTKDQIDVVLEECKMRDYDYAVCVLLEVSTTEDEDEDHDPYSSRQGGNLYDDDDDYFIRSRH